MKSISNTLAKRKSLEERVAAYLTKVITNSKDGRCCVSQERIRNAIRDKKTGKGFRKQAIADALRSLVEDGRFVRSTADNRNRPNQKHYYELPKVVPEVVVGAVKEVVPDTEKVVPKKEYRELSRNPIEESLPSGSPKLFSGKIDFGKLGRSLDRIRQIEIYLDAGLHLTPLVEGGKKPLAGWTKEKSASTPKTEMLEFFRSHPNCNVGCWLPEEIVVVDVDDYFRLFHNAQRMGGDVPFTLTDTMRCITGRTEGTGMHLWFRNTLGIRTQMKIGGFVDYKTGGDLIVLPPSSHKSGRRYVWDKITEPLNVPDAFADTSDATTKSGAQKSSAETPKKVERGVVPEPLITKSSRLDVGERYNELFRLGRSLRFSMDAERLESELRGYNLACCTEPLDERRMRRLVRDVRFGNDRKGFTAKRV